LAATLDEPRAFGYSVGDVVTRHASLRVPDGLTLDAASLPQTGQRGRALELRSVVLTRLDGGRRQELALEYQVFLAPREVRVLEMPALQLHFTGVPREQTLRIEAWPVSVAPLTPADAATRQGLGEARPDVTPPLIPTATLHTRLAVEAGIALLLLAYLAHVYVGLPWWARRHRPFGAAERALQALQAAPSADSEASRRAAFERLHAALNRTAGEVLFEPGLARFIERHPRYAELRVEFAGFFARSRRAFFAVPATTATATPAATARDDLRWLADFARRCRDIERGSL
jgi:mxaA protein